MNLEEKDGSRILMLKGNYFFLSFFILQLHSLGLRGIETLLLLVKILFTIQGMLPL